ncbi:WD repeat-containing protein 25 [Genypterus blacodes]|uniref:WD repeat-containing protein 25 n=1 Tax=Genypterus blacodes TaxID=154954 RepID=UPI003F77221F
MSLLVAYDDSDEDVGSGPVQTESCRKAGQTHSVGTYYTFEPSHSLTPDTSVLGIHEHSSPVERSRSSLSAPSQPQGFFSAERPCSGGPEQDGCFKETAACLGSPGTLEKFSAWQTFHGSNSAKRPHITPSGVRPYISKRHRLAAAVEKVDLNHPAVQISGDQTKESHILSNVSEKVNPYLAEKPEAAGIPRRLLMSLGGHQGPVNTVQWCPVPRLSHLLLSASMDKTVKVWDGVESGRCLRVFSCHAGAVRDACWTPCGQRLLTGSFDNTAAVTDVNTGQRIVKVDNQFKVMCAVLQPSNPDVFLCGGYSSSVKAWDSRCCKMVKVYKAGIQQTLDILFLRGGTEFITSSDCVSRDSADRTLIAWDYQTTAKISNQIYHERYTCPSLALHPVEDSFVAQTNGNYMALFSSQQPYRMNKRRRYDGHKVEGYAVRCGFSPDGTILASGSSTGSAHFYDYNNARVLHTLSAHSQPCLHVALHPVLPATAATCDWAGEIKVWH